MTPRIGTTLLLVTAFLMALGSVCHAKTSVQDKLMVKRAAQLDAYRQLAERILGLRLASESSVRDFVGENDRIAAAVDQFIKGVRFGELRYFDDGSCEIDAQVTIQQVVTTLKKACDEHYKGGKWKKEYFEDLERKTVTKVIDVTGSGALRPKAVVPDPATVTYVRRDSTLVLPDIFKQYPPNERLKAKRAAELDAYRLLMERIYGLEITSDTYVRDFVTESDRIRATTEGRLKGVRTMAVRYNEDGTVEVDMQVTIEQVISTIKKVHEEVYDGTRWKREQFENIAKRTQRKVISVTGTGALDTTSGAVGGGSDINSREPSTTEETIIVE